MPNRRPRGKFKMKIVNHPSLEIPGEEQYTRETKFLAYKCPHLDSSSGRVRDGWLRLDVNLQTGTPAKKLTREIGIRITEDIDEFNRKVRAREDAKILALRKKHPTWTAPTIARRLNHPLHRVKDLIHRRNKSVER